MFQMLPSHDDITSFVKHIHQLTIYTDGFLNFVFYINFYPNYFFHVPLSSESSVVSFCSIPVCESGWSDTVDSFAVKPKLTAPGKLYFLARVRANTCNFIFNKKEYFSPETKLTTLTRELERARKPDYFLLLSEYFP